MTTITPKIDHLTLINSESNSRTYDTGIGFIVNVEKNNQSKAYDVYLRHTYWDNDTQDLIASIPMTIPVADDNEKTLNEDIMVELNLKCGLCMFIADHFERCPIACICANGDCEQFPNYNDN